MTQQRNITISYLRVAALLSILFHHTICMYGGWPPLANPFSVSMPPHIGLMSASAKGIGLNFFTFISGFVLFYQTKKQQSFPKFLWKKIVRILIPCIVFGFAYWLIFPDLMFNNDPINGTHLWFLPMIFLSIVVVSVHFYIPKPFWIVIALYAILYKLGNYTTLRTLHEFRFYFMIFYAGFGFNALLSGVNIKETLSLYFSNKWAIGLLGLALLLSPLYVKVLKFAPVPTQILPIVLGCIIVYYITLYAQPILSKLDNIVLLFDRNSFAIYLLHQFVINTWCTLGYQWIASAPFAISMPAVFVSTVVIALFLAEGSDRLQKSLIKKRTLLPKS